MYNVLEKPRTGEALHATEKPLHTQGLVSVLKSLHDGLDAAVPTACGWSDLQSALTHHTQAEAACRGCGDPAGTLVALNAQRAAEEATGHVRGLRNAPSHAYSAAKAQAVAEAVEAFAAEAGALLARRETELGA